MQEERDPNRIAYALLVTLQDMAGAGLDPGRRSSNPAATVLIAQLAECAGLQFHWPAADEVRCRQLIQQFRAESSCLTPGQAAT
jgi:hypothetical protein